MEKSFRVIAAVRNVERERGHGTAVRGKPGGTVSDPYSRILGQPKSMYKSSRMDFLLYTIHLSAKK